MGASSAEATDAVSVGGRGGNSLDLLANLCARATLSGLRGNTYPFRPRLVGDFFSGDGVEEIIGGGMDDAGGSFFVGFLGIPEGLFSDLVPGEILDVRRFQGDLA